MKFSFVGKPNVISEPLKEKTMDKMARLKKFLPEDIDIKVAYKVTKLENKIEVTFFAFKRTIRAEAKANDMYSAIDDVVEVIEKQLRRLKNRLQDKQRKSAPKDGVPVTGTEEITNYDSPIIVTRKNFDIEQMEIEDAIMALELSGHGFYLFRSTATSEINVVYKTKVENEYGLIDPR
ncbi:MAG: ribosome-associated translation inhibitor RaiA [Defluviitaleaceae bacterium]|nr:ribosome-associated translation inhibitor RaiA [Defluviitaleaceae bacterium]